MAVVIDDLDFRMIYSVRSKDTKVASTQNRRLPFSNDPNVVSGATVFPGTRVPVGILFEYLADGYTINGFVDQFPTVTQTQAIEVLEYFRRWIHRDDGWYDGKDPDAGKVPNQA